MRVGLRDDWNAPNVVRPQTRLDGEPQVPLVSSGIRDDAVPGVGPGDPGPGGTVNPVVTVRERVTAGMDEDGNQLWSWTDVVRNVEAVAWEQRAEVSDGANLAQVSGDFTILYPAGWPDIRESASVESGGYVWRVTSVERFPDRIRLLCERTDDGA